MRFDKIIYLIGITTSENEIGDPIRTVTRRETFGRKEAIRQSEHYQAAAVGLKPEITFIIWEREYQGELQVEFDGVTYNVVRTYPRNDEVMELICAGLVNEVM